MSFSESSGVITQTGTDTDLSGLVGITGVTTTAFGSGVNVYQLTATLQINGTLSIDPYTEMLLIGSTSGTTDRDFFINSGGTLNIGEETTYPDGAKTYSQGTAIWITDGEFELRSGGVMNWYGGSIIHDGTIQYPWELSGEFNSFSQDCILRCNNLTDQTQVRLNTGSDITINGLVTDGFALTFIIAPTSISGWSPRNAQGAMAISSSSPSGFMVLNDFNPLGNYLGANKFDLRFWANKVVRLINCNVGTSIGAGGNSTSNSNNRGLIEVRQEVSFELSSVSGIHSLTDVKFYIRDTDSGNRIATGSTPQSIDNYDTDFTYLATTDSLGDASITADGGVLIGVTYKITNNSQFSNVVWDRRGVNNADDDIFDIQYIGYLYSLGSLSPSLRGTGGTTLKVSGLDDLLVTQSTKATVDTYTTLDDAYELYDRAKSYLYDNYAGEASAIVSRSGNQIDLGAVDLVINATAGSAFAFATNTITVKSSTFTGGATSTTGTVTIQNGALLSVGTFDCDVNYQGGAGTTLTNVTCTGTLDFDTAGTYTLSGCTIDEVTNSSGGAVILNIDASTVITTNTGPNITINAPTGQLDFTGLESGSQIVVFNTGTQTEQYRNNSTGTTDSTTALTAGTYDYTIMKSGFIPVRVVGVVIAASPVAVGVSQVADLNYLASHGLIYTTDASWASNQLTVPTFGPTGQAVYSLLIDSFIAEAALTNTAFCLQMNGPQSLIFINDAEGATDGDIENLTQTGVEYRDSSGTETAEWVGIDSSGVQSGSQVEYQQETGGSISDTRVTGDVDELIKTFGDVTHGNFDYRDYLDIKVQTNGYRQAEVDLLAAFGISQISPILYIISLSEIAISGLTLGDPSITGVSLTDDSASPVSWDAGDGAKDYSITLTDTNSNTGEDILRWLNYNLSLDATFQGKNPFDWPEMVLDNGSAYETLIGTLHKAGGDVTAGVRVIDGSGDPHIDFTRFQADDGTYGTPPTQYTAAVDNIVAGSRLQIYNVTTATEVYNDIVAGTSYSAVYVEGSDYTSGDTVRIRLTYQSTVTAKLGFPSTTVAGAGFTFLADQEDDTVYNTIGVDGSTITQFTADYINDEVDIITASDFSGTDLYARFVYFEFTEEGIREFFGGFTAVDIANYKNDVTVLDLYLNNNTSTNLKQTDNVRLYKSNGVYPVRNPTTGGGGVDVVWRSQVYIAETGVSGLTASESSKLLSLDTGDVTINTADKAVLVDAVWDEVIDNANHNTAKSAGKRLRQAGTSLAVEGSIDDPTPTTASFITDLTQTESSFYADQTCIFISGDLEGQARIITSYNSGTKVLTFDEPWTIAPSDTDEFEIKADHVHPVSQIQENLDTLTNIKPSIPI